MEIFSQAQLLPCLAERCVSVNLCAFVCAMLHAYVNSCACMRTSMCVCVYEHAFLSVHMRVLMSVCLCACVCPRVGVCVCPFPCCYYLTRMCTVA